MDEEDTDDLLALLDNELADDPETRAWLADWLAAHPAPPQITRAQALELLPFLFPELDFDTAALLAALPPEDA